MIKTRRAMSGFTLIEIMTVVVIIAFMAGMAVMALGGNNSDDKMKQEAQRLAELIRLAGDQAIMRGKELGIELTETGYRFAVLENRKWKAVSDLKEFSERKLPEPLKLNIALDSDAKELFGNSLSHKDEEEAGGKGGGSKGGAKDGGKGGDDKGAGGEDAAADGEPGAEDESSKLNPQIFILSSGEISPFAVGLGVDEDKDDDSVKPKYWRIRSMMDGSVRLDGPHDGSLTHDLELGTEDEREQEEQRDDEQDPFNEDARK